MKRYFKRDSKETPEYVVQKPSLAEFGYTQESFKVNTDLLQHKKQKNQSIVIAIFILIVLALIIYFFSKSFNFNENLIFNLFMFFLAFMNWIVISLAIFFFTLFPLNALLDIQLEKKFANLISYKSKTKAYEYWEKRLQKEHWLTLTGVQFEKELADLFRVAGYKVSLTKGSGDKGIDIVLSSNQQNIFVQCKAHNKPVGPAIAREIFGVLIDSKYDKAILASTNGFTKGVFEFCQDKQIELWDIDKIIEFKKSLIII